MTKHNSKRQNSQKFRAWILIPVILFIGYFYVVGERYPVHSDLIQSADRALNLYDGLGYKTTSNPNFSPEMSFAVSNAPLHDFSLLLWLKTFGNSLQSIRSYNYFFAMLIGIFVIAGVKKFGIIRNELTASLMLLVMLFSSPLALSYSYGRYDTIGIFIMSLAFYCATLGDRRIRYTLLVVCGLLLALSGIQFAPYGFLVSILIISLTGTRHLFEIVAVAIGGILGYLMLGIGYWKLEIFDNFVNDILFYKHTTATVKGRWANIPIAIINNRTNSILLTFLGLVSLSIRLTQPLRRIVLIGVLSGLAIPALISVAGNYTRWYAWMAFLPIVVICFHTMDQSKLESRIKFGLIASFSLLLIGSSAAKTSISSILEWKERDYAMFESFIWRNVEETDILLNDAYTFLGSKRISKNVFSYKTINILSDERKASINKLFYSYGGGSDHYELNELFKILGGEWVYKDSYKIDRSALRQRLFDRPKEKYVYDVVIYARDTH